jgi:type IX secretion system PorP/SprF family membrane protein
MENCRYKGLVVLILIIWNSSVNAQDPQFSQVFAAPIYLNPAFTGATRQDRVAISHRRQWMGLTDGYVSSVASYDHNFSKKKLGLGLIILNDRAGLQGLRFTEISATLSKDLPVGVFNGFRLGLKFGQTVRSFDRDKVIFWDELYSGSDGSYSEPLILDKLRYFDSGSGVLYYSKRFWAGINANHLNRPQQSFLGDQHRMDVKMSLHIGTEFRLEKKRGSYFSSRSIKPVVLYKFQQDWDQLDLGAYYEDDGLRLGLWYRGLPINKKGEPDYRNNDALVFLVGCELNGQLQLGYSYDVTLSNLTVRSGGSHELSLIYEWPYTSRQSDRKKAIPCPRF